MTKQIPLSQGLVALVDDDMYEYLSQWQWRVYRRRAAKTLYAVRTARSKSDHNGTLIRMHRVIMNAPKNTQIDHVNGNGLDNRRSNLRICTGADNSRNRSMYKNNKSGYKGVRLIKNIHKYYAQIVVSGKRVHLGSFDLPEEAARAYDVAARKYFGEFARTNFEVPS